MKTSVKEQAIQDIKQELKSTHRNFLAFHKELDPIMGKLVRQQLKQQSSLSFGTHANAQLVAHCFFCKGKVNYHNYSKYYGNR